MKLLRVLLGRLSNWVGHGMHWRLWLVFGVVLWLFVPPPRDSHAACAPWEGGPCIDVRPTPGSGERPPRERDDTELSPHRSSGPGCASNPGRPSSDDGEPTPVAGTPHPSLRHVVWSTNGQFRPADGYRWVRPDDPNDFSVEPQPDGSPHPTLPNVVWAGNGQFHPAYGYRWVDPNNPNDFRVMLYPDGTPHLTLPNVVWDGQGQFYPAPGYGWRDPGNPNDFQVVRQLNVANWASDWRSEDRVVVVDVLRGMKDAELMDWMATHVQFGRFPDDNVSPLSASGAMLRFKDVYFDRRTSPAQRENLLAFEGGKVFYETMKEVSLEDGRTFERWFLGYYPAHSSVISDMSEARHEGQPLGTTDFVDAHSAFGHLFRAQALELERPIGQDRQKDWDEVQQAFRQRLDQVMRRR